MRRTLLAGSLLLAVLTCRKSLVCVFLKLDALLAKSLVSLLLAAVQPDHQGNGMLLSLYPIHYFLMS